MEPNVVWQALENGPKVNVTGIGCWHSRIRRHLCRRQSLRQRTPATHRTTKWDDVDDVKQMQATSRKDTHKSNNGRVIVTCIRYITFIYIQPIRTELLS